MLDILKKHLNQGDYVVVRHSLGENECKKAWEAGLDHFEEYQSIQKNPNYYKGKRYVVSFISSIGTTARFVGCYEMTGVIPIEQVKPKDGYPNVETYSDEGAVYIQLQKTSIMEDLQGRLVIDWGGSVNTIVQYSDSSMENKEVKQITPKYDFTSYDDVCYSFSELEEIIKNKIEYYDIYKALSSVNGVYVVLDTVSGDLYVGSAYGAEGIWGRWETYVNTNGAGGDEVTGNKKILELLAKDPQRYRSFQYSLLETIRRTGNIAKDEAAALACERSYKKKLGTMQFGLNAN